MKTSLFKRLTESIVTIVVLLICLCITSVALVIEASAVNGNLFSTGSISVNLNNNVPVISVKDCTFGPGKTVERSFFVENNGTWAAYYKLYFSNVHGGMADDLYVTVKDGDEIIYEGSMVSLTCENTDMAEKELAVGEKRNLSVSFYYLPAAENPATGAYVTFDLKADAVQSKNNPQKQFS